MQIQHLALKIESQMQLQNGTFSIRRMISTEIIILVENVKLYFNFKTLQKFDVPTGLHSRTVAHFTFSCPDLTGLSRLVVLNLTDP